MRIKWSVMLLTCLLIALSPLAVAGAQGPDSQANAAEDSSVTTLASDPQPAYVGSSMRPGFYAARDNRNLPASQYNLVGGHQSFGWDLLEPTENNYQWHYVDGFIAAAMASGKQAVGIGITTYDGRLAGGIKVPAWVNAKGARFITCSGGHQIPRYWDAVFKREYEDLIKHLAQHLINTGQISKVEFIQIGVGVYMETQPSLGTSDDACVEAVLIADGFTRYTWPFIVNDITDIYRRQFGGTSVKLLLLSEPTYYNIEGDRKKWMEHAVRNGVGLQPAGLHADREWVDLRTKVSGGNSWHGFGKYDYMLDQAEESAFTTWEHVPMAHEAYDYMFGGQTDQGRLPDERQFFWGVAAGLSRKVDYITIERNALYVGLPNDPQVTPIESHIRFMGWAAQYMGKYVSDTRGGKPMQKTPSVWALMRDTAYVSTLFPQQGNYTFWLTQDDSVAGGRTRVATYRRRADLDIIGNMTGTSLQTRADIITSDDDASLSALQNRDPSDPMDTTPSYKGWICRRTDQATGNRRMYFRIDDRYFVGGPTQATITVTYFDRGTDQWRLVGHNAAGAEVTLQTVTKGNTNRWKTVAINVTNGYFSNLLLGGTDFFIDCQGDGDEYIHMVDLRAGSSPAQTHRIDLTASNGGWNLVSFRLRPTSTAIADVLSSIAGKYEVVQAWKNGAWASYVPGVGGALTALDETMGFWIKVNQNCTLVVSGQAPESTTIPLSAASGGWNLVGWPSDDSRPIATVISPISGNCDVVYSYNAFDAADPWKIYSPLTPPYANDLTQVSPGMGMWIHAVTNANLVVDY
ncbi:MAG: hypothetical protein FJZ90_11285 [Chloroflexi bacterium]|nr:hypothetical protein [Chloroflexota bacterium]